MNQVAAREAIRVVLADDHELVRSAIVALLSFVEGVEVIAEACNGDELVSVVEHLQPDLVMTDITMPGMDGLAAVAHIHRRWPQVRLVVLSMHDTVDFVKRAVASGACGYLMKNAPSSELHQAIRSVMASGSYFSPSIAQQLLRPSEPTVADQLTQRQIEVLSRIARGRSSKEIAFELGLSSKTVDVHRARIMQRLELRDVASMTRYAVRNGLVKA
ncbi:MAG: response regulator transcription factor [Ramlibacter sp.]|nr:response regulator transcription factor [Ramlibacter sp.]